MTHFDVISEMKYLNNLKETLMIIVRSHDRNPTKENLDMVESFQQHIINQQEYINKHVKHSAS